MGCLDSGVRGRGVRQHNGASLRGQWPGTMDSFDGDLHDKPSLQNGAKLYMNYCLGCHSLKFQRYQRMADDLGMPYEAVQDNLIFTGQKIGELMKIGMHQETAKAWFGAPPPDFDHGTSSAGRRMALQLSARVLSR